MKKSVMPLQKENLLLSCLRIMRKMAFYRMSVNMSLFLKTSSIIQLIEFFNTYNSKPRCAHFATGFGGGSGGILFFW